MRREGKATATSPPCLLRTHVAIVDIHFVLYLVLWCELMRELPRNCDRQNAFVIFVMTRRVIIHTLIRGGVKKKNGIIFALGSSHCPVHPYPLHPPYIGSLSCRRRRRLCRRHYLPTL